MPDPGRSSPGWGWPLSDGVIRRAHGAAVAASLRASEKPYPVRAFESGEEEARIGRAVSMCSN
jgi:DeoR/GlpR family transcriptional regulator of sugar metabolism